MGSSYPPSSTLFSPGYPPSCTLFQPPPPPLVHNAHSKRRSVPESSCEVVRPKLARSLLGCHRQHNVPMHQMYRYQHNVPMSLHQHNASEIDTNWLAGTSWWIQSNSYIRDVSWVNRQLKHKYYKVTTITSMSHITRFYNFEHTPTHLGPAPPTRLCKECTRVSRWADRVMEERQRNIPCSSNCTQIFPSLKIAPKYSQIFPVLPRTLKVLSSPKIPPKYWDPPWRPSSKARVQQRINICIWNFFH